MRSPSSHTLLSSHGGLDRRVKIVATQVEGEMGVIEAAGGRLLHHHLLHVHVGAGRLATISGEKILPGFGVEIDARKSQTRHFLDASAHRLAIAIKRFEKISEPDSQQRVSRTHHLQTCLCRWRMLRGWGAVMVHRPVWTGIDPRSAVAGSDLPTFLEVAAARSNASEVSLESASSPIPVAIVTSRSFRPTERTKALCCCALRSA